jgi:putative membrane protein insertion efficiency factor|tara:strand:+ start:175 stop:408 length:234 start_codon:yes stop_codon:yes gene_type:complete
MKTIPIFFILMYQKFISPLLRPSCRFHPTCSEYSIQAITKYGAIKGMFLSLKRILRCNPWGGSGLDPIPGDNKNGSN